MIAGIALIFIGAAMICLPVTFMSERSLDGSRIALDTDFNATTTKSPEQSGGYPTCGFAANRRSDEAPEGKLGENV